jgi:hypothetical protein
MFSQSKPACASRKRMTASASSVKRLTGVSKQRTPALRPWSHPSANTSAKATRKNSAGSRNVLGAEAPPALYPGDYNFRHNPARLPKTNRRNRCSPRSSAVPARNCWGRSDSCMPAWSSAMPLPAAFVGLPKYRSQRSEISNLVRLRRFYDRGIERLEERWSHNGISGEEFEPPDDIYVADLNLFGHGSLFERLCIARTHLGCERLAH